MKLILIKSFITVLVIIIAESLIHHPDTIESIRLFLSIVMGVLLGYITMGAYRDRESMAALERVHKIIESTAASRVQNVSSKDTAPRSGAVGL